MAIYLDHNATTPLLPEVLDALVECYRAGHANPASQHHAGRAARRVLEEAREEIGRFLGADVASLRPDRVILTSGATEANNLALLGLAGESPGHVIVSAIEHPSVLGVADELARRGWQVDRLPVTPDGVVRVDRLAELLTTETRLVSVMLGNNETGVIQSLAECAAVCQAAGVPLHTDAVQAVGKMSVSFRELGVAALTATAHKLHGPRGIGALVVRPDLPLAPILFGGFQQQGLRPGTESVALAVGFAAAIRFWRREGDSTRRRMVELRDSFEAALRQRWPEIVVNGAKSPRLPHTSNVAFPGVDRQALLMALDLAGVACSTGSTCASGSSELSHVLLAMGCPAELATCALRFSIGATTTPAEMAEAAERIAAAADRLRR